MNESNLAIVLGKSDADKAADLKARLGEALGHVGEIMDKAQAEGFQVNFAMGKDYRGVNVVANLQIMKVY